jgi:hypothetical protein
VSRRPPRPPVRVAWVEGAKLRHADLRDAVAHEARMLALHVSAVHRAWGVALGLEVVIDASARDLIVTPGLAYTCAGDALVSSDALDPGAPSASGAVGAGIAFDLVASRASAVEGAPCERLAACAGALVRERGIALRWEMAGPVAAGDPPLAASIRLGDDVPLARVVRRADGTLAGPDYARRRIARGLGRPHVASGVLAPGALAWREDAHRVVATVDASDRGFTTTPRIFVSITAPATWSASLVGPFVAVERASAASFDVALSAAARGAGVLSPRVLRDVAGSLTLAWTGVEMARGCPPSLRPFRNVGRAGALLDATAWLARIAELEGIAP